MSIFDIFNRKKTNIPIVQQASATLYPDKILIYTYDKVKEGFGIATNKVSIISVNSDDEILGSKIRYHLSLTIMNQPIPSDYKAEVKSFLKAAGFKTVKQQYMAAKYLNITIKESELTISPSTNGGATGKNRGFWFNNGILKFNADIKNDELGRQVRDAWNMCTIS